jgi:hypothetical protein
MEHVVRTFNSTKTFSYSPALLTVHYKKFNPLHSPTNAHSMITNCTYVLNTATLTCSGAEVPFSGSLKYKGVQAPINVGSTMHCIGVCTPLYMRLPEDGASGPKRVVVVLLCAVVGH